MKAIIVVSSYHHKNTEKVALRIAGILDAQVVAPQQIDPPVISSYDLVGFGSGIYDAKHHKSLLALADELPSANGTKAFIFSTDGVPRTLFKSESWLRNKTRKDHAPLREKLQAKGYEVIDEFNCAGFNTNVFLKYFGGVNKGRPDNGDLAQAEKFAYGIITRQSRIWQYSSPGRQTVGA
jgi:flavodoxin